MKRTIIVIALLTALFLPAVTTAQVRYDNLTAEHRIVLIREIKAKIQELMTILISMLQEQLKTSYNANSIQTPPQTQTDVTNPVDTSPQVVIENNQVQDNIQTMTKESKIEEVAKFTLEVIDPLPGKGRGERKNSRGELVGYQSSPQIVDESNYIELGIVIRDGSGKFIETIVLTITATDSSQDKILNGTGNVKKIANKDGTIILTPYYPYTYEFKTSGKHQITFSAEGQTARVELDVK